MDIPSQLIHQLLRLSGKEWELEQEILASKGLARSFRMLEAAKGRDTQLFIDSVMEQMRQRTKAIAADAQTLQIRSLHFRMLSRAACSLHFLIRKPREGQPFQFFLNLEHRDGQQYRPGPKCLEDELAQEFYAQHPEWNPVAEACLETLARSIQMDVAAIESKHASSRRIALYRSTQNWTTQLESLSAEWTMSQIRIASLQGPADPEEEPQQDGEQADGPEAKRRRTGPGKQAGARGGGGGAWRAFLHEFFAGRGRMTGSEIRRAASVYRDLPQAEHVRLLERGRQALMAWREGFASFGARRRTRQLQLPAEVADDFQVDAVAQRDFEEDKRDW